MSHTPNNSLPSVPPKEVTTVFGEVLRELRRERGLSQEKLAFAAGLERNFISLLELGQQMPSLGTLLKLAVGLQLKASVVVARVEVRCPVGGGMV